MKTKMRIFSKHINSLNNRSVSSSNSKPDELENENGHDENQQPIESIARPAGIKT